MVVGGDCATDASAAAAAAAAAAAPRPPPSLSGTNKARSAPPPSKGKGGQGGDQQHLGAVVFLAPQRLRTAFGYTRPCLLRKAIESVDRRLNVRHGPYPIYVVVPSDPGSDPEQMDGPYAPSDRAEMIADLSDRTRVTFVEVPMYSGQGLEANVTAQQLDRWIDGHDGGTGGRPLGYRSMCRLWSGRVQRMDFLKPYRYYMRMDDDSFLTSDFVTDPFLDMERRKLKYAYRRPFMEKHGVEVLWRIAKPFMDDEAKSNMVQMGLLLRNKMVSDDYIFVGVEPYNNFHVSAVSMWSEPKWLAFTRAVEKYHGFFKHRIGDATVHAVALGMLLRPEEVQVWTTVPYVHNVNDLPTYPPAEWAGQCDQLAVEEKPPVIHVGDTGGRSYKIEGLEKLGKAMNKK